MKIKSKTQTTVELWSHIFCVFLHGDILTSTFLNIYTFKMTTERTKTAQFLNGTDLLRDSTYPVKHWDQCENPLSCQVDFRVPLNEILLLVFGGCALAVCVAAEGDLVASFGLSCFHFPVSIRLFPAADESGHYGQSGHSDKNHNSDHP